MDTPPHTHTCVNGLPKLISECGLAVLFTANVLWDILTYLAWSLTATVVEINPLQKKLLGVKDDGM